MSIRGVIFDMDGVLCDSEPFICEAAMRMFEQTYGVIVRREDFAPFVGTGEDRFIGGVAEKYDIPLTMPRDKNQTYAIYLEIIRGRLHALPGAIDFVAACRRRGIKTALATSADAVKMRGNLHEIRIPPDSFDVIVTGDDVARKKPDPQIFQLAAARLELDPRDTLVIEDAQSGIRAAKAAGAVALGITSSFSAESLRECGADYIAKDLNDVPPHALGSD